MPLFAQRLLTDPGQGLTDVPGVYDESRSVRVDHDGRAIVAMMSPVALMTTRADLDPDRTCAQLGTRGEIDPEPSVDLLATVTKTADIDRDEYSATLAAAPTVRARAVELMGTRTAGGIDEDEDRVLSAWDIASSTRVAWRGPHAE